MYLLSILIHPVVFLPIGNLMLYSFCVIGNMDVQSVENSWKKAHNQLSLL